VEVLSPRTARRDRGPKRDIYERNGVREYWLVDPRRREIIVLARGTAGHFVTACAAAGERPARSALLSGFVVRPCDVFP
jgi:Uma2 family endonuclease